MSEISDATHYSIADTIAAGVYPDCVHLDVQFSDDRAPFSELYDDLNLIHYYHNPGSATADVAAGHLTVPLNARLTCPISDGSETASRQRNITGPYGHVPHDRALDGPTKVEARVATYDIDATGNVISSAFRLSSNPDRTYRALARLARLAASKIDAPQ
jgi:hypothetical protein